MHLQCIRTCLSGRPAHKPHQGESASLCSCVDHHPTSSSQSDPTTCVDQVTEIRGFNDPQKEEYFRKRIRDENLASRTIKHLKSSRTLYIMCHIPVFCWITATVVERTSDESESVEMTRCVTQMYTHFLIIQTSMKNEKYTERKERDEEMIFKLG